jgi:hypothetical protein
MSSVGRKLAGELCNICEEIGDALKSGHHVGHDELDRDARQMARDVDATEVRVASMVPVHVQLPVIPTFAQDKMPGWSPNEHVFRGEMTSPSVLTGYHGRPGGLDVGRERVDLRTVKHRPDGIYLATWRLTGADGHIIRKPGGGDLKKKSTFWPDHWTREDVEQAVAESYWDAVANGMADEFGFTGYTAGGHPVRGYFDGLGIVTAFPNYPPSWNLGDPTP